SIPAFWLATLLNNFFTTPAFNMDWFPTMGVGEVSENASWWEVLKTRVYYLCLPILSLVLPSLAYLSRQMRTAVLAELDKAYVKTARLKGMSVHRLLWGHVFRNALFPIITLLAGLFPAMIAGSVLVERIFNLPGMGRMLIEAALAQDWPVMLTILLFNGLLTALGILLADISYALADPRLRTKAQTA
ncbi:MAG: ABC transporter permease, partial [Bacteroidota bacterium]